MAPKPKKTSTSYSPAPMSAAAKKKTAKRAEFVSAYSKAKQIPAKNNSSVASKVGKALSNTPAGKVVKRAKIVAREVRDIPTAAANIYESRSLPAGGVAKFAKKDLKKQIKEVGSAIKSGKKGTEAAKQTGITRKEMKGRVGAGGLDYYISRPKKPRK